MKRITLILPLLLATTSCTKESKKPYIVYQSPTEDTPTCIDISKQDPKTARILKEYLSAGEELRTVVKNAPPLPKLCNDTVITVDTNVPEDFDEVDQAIDALQDG